MSTKEHPPLHVPVLLDAVLRLLDPKKGENYLDLTAGYGGHARAVLARTENYEESCLVDRDSNAIAELHDIAQHGTKLLHADFLSAATELANDGVMFDLILLDLGVSSPQLDRAERGFSFTKNGPLDMRMDNRQTLTAERVANTWKKDEIAQIIRTYGEESPRVSARYADAITKHRPYHTTEELANTIKTAHVGKWSRIHPATRTFQAFRIVVNDELGQIERTLPLMSRLLKPGGRVAVISFHSLEDRIVKRYFAEETQAGYEAELQVLTKHPVLGDTEDVHNPRSRSAKLRAAVKNKQKEKGYAITHPSAKRIG